MTTSKSTPKWPFCPAAAEHGRMVPYEPATPEQAFCIEGGGRWLKCTQCTSSIIEQGTALKTFLATFKKSARPEETPTMQPFPAEPDETLTNPAYRANNDPPGCSIVLVIQGRGATERGHFVVDFGAVQVASVLSYRGTTSHAGAYQEARIAAWTWHDHAETTYAITVDPAHEAASDWFAQADEAELTRTLASARDLARDLGVPLILRDDAGFIRGFVHADGGYRMV